MLDQPFDNIGEPDLLRLVENRVAEGRSLEFKRELPGGRDADRKEFLGDVTSFANAQGGDLVFGVEEAGGVATGVPGVQADDPDAAILRLDSMLQDGIAPRLIGVRLRWVRLENGSGVLVMRIPTGLAAPHRVTFQNSGRFFTRNSAGKYEMDVHDLRHAFTESDGLPRRFRQLHAEAIERARGQDMPFPITPNPTAVVSVMPLALFREDRDIPITRDYAIVPPETGGYSNLDMIEGILVHSAVTKERNSARSFALTYRTGRVDVAWNIGGLREFEGRNLHLVFAPNFEAGLLDAAVATQTKLRMFNVEGPWVIFVSVYGVRDHLIRLPYGDATNPAYRDEALLGELRVERIDESALLPIANNFWLLFGERRREGQPLGQR